MKKVLTNIAQYTTQARFASILFEAFTERNGRIPIVGDTYFGQGEIKNNAITGNIGLVVDTENKDYCVLPEPHLSRLVDVVEGDGWCDVVVEEVISQ